MEINNQFKNITIKTNEVEESSFQDKVVIKSDDSISISKGSFCQIESGNIDDTIQIISSDNSITVEDINTNSATIVLLTSDNLTNISEKINLKCSENNVRIKSRVSNPNSFPAKIFIYTIELSEISSINLTGDATLLSELQLTSQIKTSSDDNSIILGVNNDGNTIGTPTDGTYDDGAIGTYTDEHLTSDTTVANAIDMINEYLLGIAPLDNGISLDGSILTIIGASLQSGIIADDPLDTSGNTYNSGEGLGKNTATDLIITDITSFHLRSILFKEAHKGIIEVIFNGITKGQFNLVSPFIIADGKGEQDVSTPSYDASPNGMDIISIGWYNNFIYFQQGQVDIIVEPVLLPLVNGYNEIILRHSIDGIPRNTEKFKFFFNNQSSIPSYVSGTTTFDFNNGNISARRLSGIYHITDGFNALTTAVIDNVFKHCYPEQVMTIEEGSVYENTVIQYNDIAIVGALPRNWDDNFQLLNKRIPFRDNQVFYDSGNSINIKTSNLKGTWETWYDITIENNIKQIGNTASVLNNNATIDNLHTEEKRIPYGFPFYGIITNIIGNSIFSMSFPLGIEDRWIVITNGSNIFYKKIISRISSTELQLDDTLNIIIGNSFEVFHNSLCLTTDCEKNPVVPIWDSNLLLTDSSLQYSDFISGYTLCEAQSIACRIVRPTKNFTANYFPPTVGGFYSALNGKTSVYVIGLKTPLNRTGAKLVLSGYNDLTAFNNQIKEIRLTIPFEDKGNGYDCNIIFDPRNIPLYRGVLTEPYDSALGNPQRGQGLRLGDIIYNSLTGNVEIDFTTGTISNELSGNWYILEFFLKTTGPEITETLNSTNNNLLKQIEITDR